MDFDTFLSSASLSNFWQQRASFCFVGNEYPVTWFTKLFTLLSHRKLLPAPYQRIFIGSTDIKSVYASLSQSILGSYSFFWLGDISEEKESKSLQEFVEFLFSYQGPHCVAYFINQSSKLLGKRRIDSIVLQSEISISLCLELAKFLEFNFDAKKTAFVKRLLSANASIDLETCCMIFNYLDLAGTRYLDDYEAFFTHVIGISPSLSMLAENFFARNTKSFFGIWSSISKEYPEVFWISFWSEQLWKSYHVLNYLREKNFVAAKKMGFRLPYTFMNRDWQKSNTKELAKAYEFLYSMDYALKTGSTFCAIDLFYLNYFTGKFV